MQTEIDECKEQLLTGRKILDFLTCQLVYLEDEERINVEVARETLKEWCQQWERRMEETTDRLSSLETDLTELKKSQDDEWDSSYSWASDYFDGCLQSKFKAKWSVDERTCCDLRNIMDQAHLISHNQKGLDELKSRKSWVRSSVYSAKKALKSASLEGMSQKLEASRKDKLDEELKNIESEMRTREDDQRLRRTIIEDQKKEFYEEVKSLLRANGRIRIASSHSGDERSHQEEVEPGRSANIPDPRREHQSSEDPQDDRGPSTPPAASPSWLQARYGELWNTLDELNHELQIKQSELMVSEVEHLSTFRRSTHRTYQAIVETELQIQAHAISNTEGDLLAIQNRLDQIGQPVPAGSLI